MKQKRSANTELSSNPAIWALILLICIVPLTITTALYNQADLPKSAMLVFAGGFFMTIVIFYILIKGDFSKLKLTFNKQLDVFVLGLLGAAILSAIFSLNTYISFWGQYQRQVGLNLIIYLVLIYFFASAVLSDRKNLTTVLFAMELTAAVIALYAILQEFGADPFGIQPGNVKRPVSTVGNSVFAGGFLVMVLPLSVLNDSEKKNLFLKYLLPLLIICGIIVSRTRSAYIALAIQAIVFVFFYGKSGLSAKAKGIKFPVKAAFIAGIVLFLLILLMMLFPENKYIARIISISGEGSNPRLLLWRDSFNIFLKYPLFGPGLGMFPNALEEFYSYQLRYTDTIRYFDHAHNNYLHALYTMGIVGLAAYVLFLVSQFRSCINGFLNVENYIKDRKIHFSLFLMLTAYSVYGLTNFDDITIMLYLFVFAAIIRAMRTDNRVIKVTSLNRLLTGIVAIALILYFGYNVYVSYKKVEADSYFLKGVKGFADQRFRDGAEETNKAIIANGNCSFYRYSLALNVCKYAISSTKLEGSAKKELLVQSLAEVTRAEKNFINKNECDALRSLILYELGRKEEADRLKDEVLAGNPINSDYRVSLAYYYFNSGDTVLADEMIESVLKVVPGAISALNAGAFFSIKRNEMEKARDYCNKILALDPNNRSAKELLKYTK